MATDYVVRFTGQDNLSGTINQIKQRLEDVGSSTSQLDNIKQKFERIEQSTAPLKKKLRDLKTLMADMNLNGLSNTDLFSRMAQQAGTYADAMADATAATNAFANDNFKLEAMAQGLTGIAGAAAVATGVMGLLGSENEDVARAIQKVQSVLAILNGVQAVANVLNKDSALMLRLKQIRTAASTAATTQHTTALTANTVAETVNSTATKRGTVVQNAWNVAKAVAKALLGDFTGLILVGAGALLAYSMATDSSKQKTEEHTKAIKDAKTEFQSYQEAVAGAIGQCVTQFLDLQRGWKQCKSTMEKNQFIKDNKALFEAYGLSINTVDDAENILVNNTSTFVSAINERAKAMAQFERLKQAWVDSLTSMDELGGEKVVKELVGAGQKLTQAQEKWLNDLAQQGVNTFGVWNNATKGADGRAVVNGIGAREFNELWMAHNYQQRYDVNKHNQYLNSQRNIQSYTNQLQNSNLPTTTPKKPTTPTNTKKNTPTYDDGSVAAERAELQRLQQVLVNTKFASEEARQQAIEAVREQFEKVQTMEAAIKWEVQPEVDMSDNTIAGLNNQIKAIDKRLTEEVLTDSERAELVLQKQAKVELRTQIEIKNGTVQAPTEPTYIEQQREAYKNAMEQIAQMQTDYQLHIITKDEASEQLKKINEQLEKLGLKPIELYVNANGLEEAADAVETYKERMDNVSGAVGSFGSAFDSLGQAIGGTGGAMLEMAGQTAQAVAQIIPQIVALIGAKEGEALASGTASAAGLPFPANIAAIASIIATITALFATFAGKFADGGIIGGSAYHGDMMLARVNAGEMILNKRQQANLFNALDKGTNGGVVVLKAVVKGTDIHLIDKNYQNKMSKIKTARK